MNIPLLPPPPTVITQASVCLSLQTTDTPLFTAPTGVSEYDPNTKKFTITVMAEPGTPFGATPLVGNTYGIVFTDVTNNQTMMAGTLTGASESNDRGPGWFRFEEADNDYNMLSWLCYGCLASDDFMWGVECPVHALKHLLAYPVIWVEGLNQLPGLDPNMPPITLLKTFTIQVSLDKDHKVTEDRVHIEGISGTGIVRVVVSAQAAGSITDNVLRSAGALVENRRANSVPTSAGEPDPDYAQYWKTVYHKLKKEDRPTMIYDPATGRAFGHIKIYSAGLSNLPRHEWIAAYLAARTVDPAGYVEFLGRFHEWTIMSPGESDATPTPSQPYPSRAVTKFAVPPTSLSPQGELQTTTVSLQPGTNMVFTYASHTNSTAECCDIQFGTASQQSPSDPLTFTVDSGTAKDY